MNTFNNHTKDSLAIILSRFPYPLEKGDKLRAFNQIKYLSKNYNIHLFTLTHQNITKKDIEVVSPYCQALHVYKITKWTILLNLIIGIFSNKPFQTHYFFSFRAKKNILNQLNQIKPKHLYAQLIRTTEYIKDYHNCPKSLDYMDALSKGIERRISRQPWYLKWLFKIESKRLKEYERSIFDYFENKIIISEQDKQYIFHPENKNIHCIPNGIDDAFFEKMELEKKYDLVFVGNLSYPPNIEAVQFIIKNLLIHQPKWTCLIAGAMPSRSIRHICKNQNVTLLENVKDIREAYTQGRIFIAPMMIGTGMQNKLLEAMALGIPCITTDLANNAIKAPDQECIFVANDAKHMQEAIKMLLENERFYQKIAFNAKDFVKNHFSWAKSTQNLMEIMIKNPK